MQRRDFLGVLGGAVAWPLAARAQQPQQMRRIGVLMTLAKGDPEEQSRYAAFHQELQQLGWTDGRNVRIDVRWAAGNAADVRKYAAELVALAPDVIVASGAAGVGPMLQTTRTVPIVFVIVPDPVGAGFVTSLSRPGGNATGFLMFEYSIVRKMAGTAQTNRAGRDASGCPSGSRHHSGDWPIRRYPVGGAVGRRGREPG